MIDPIEAVHLYGVRRIHNLLSSRPFNFRFLRVFTQVFAVLLLNACSCVPLEYEVSDLTALEARAVEQSVGPLRVRASVPDAQESRRIFGVPVYDRGIQPVWIEVTNSAPWRTRFSLSSLDPDYFSPLEVAWQFKKRLSKDGWKQLEDHLHGLGMPRQIAPGETVSGFVFTHLESGTKSFNVDLFETGRENGLVTLSFFVDVPGFVPDYATLDFPSLYSADELTRVDEDGLRTLMSDFPCCTVEPNGGGEGRPFNMFLVAHGEDLLKALLRAGWSETPSSAEPSYRDASGHFHDRAPDAIFRKGRSGPVDRVELRLWLTPVRVSGKPLWVGQVNSAIGRFFDLGDRLFGVRLDPDVTEGRNFLLQDLLYAQSLKHWAWSETGIEVPYSEPREDYASRPWFAMDAFRLVVWVSGQPVSMAETTPIEWDSVRARRVDQP